jgi:3',5'-cyclic AMP phosphodiesterase CpdA
VTQAAPSFREALLVCLSYAKAQIFPEKNETSFEQWVSNRFGKRLFQEHIGRRYYSFAHKGWYFLALDSIGITRDRQYTGYVDSEQLEWLKRELAMIGKSAPIVVVTHMPLVTGYLAYGSLTKLLPPDALVVSNAREVLDILQPYNVKTVLQGHLHVREVVDNALGCRYITSGAVCGNWWRGPRDGHPEGFSRFSITGNTIRWQYYTYGFRSEEHISETPSIVMQPT